MSASTKRIIVSFPVSLYEDVREAAKRKFQSVTNYIRQSMLEKVGEEFSADELEQIDRGRKEFRSGRGTAWKSVKRG